MAHFFKTLELRLQSRMNRQLQDLDLTPAQGHIIGFLAHSPDPPCARDLEQFFSLSHPTVSGLLSRMEAKGFVAVEPDPIDRRVKRIYLLEKGMACSRQIEATVRNNESTIVYGFTEEEKERFEDFLLRAIRNLSDDSPASEFTREE